jgi:hypothetical protein
MIQTTASLNATLLNYISSPSIMMGSAATIGSSSSSTFEAEL